jgi:hypothetical protein
MVPGILVVPSAFLGILLDRERIWMAVTLGGGSKEVSHGPDRVDFLYLGGRLDFCAGAARGVFWIGPCVALAAGGVHAEGRSGNPTALDRTQQDTEAWLEPSFGARAAWQPLQWIQIDLLGGVGFPLVRSEYYFSPKSDASRIYEVRAAAPFVGLGAGIRLP